MEVFLVQQNDDSLDNEEVVQQLLEKSNLNQEEKSKENVVVISGQQGDFQIINHFKDVKLRGKQKLLKMCNLLKTPFIFNFCCSR